MTANGDKTHCKRGHPLSGKNLYVRPDGWRECRACRDFSDLARKCAAPPKEPRPRSPKPLRSHCKFGHEYSPENTWWRRRNDGRMFRRCVECSRAAARIRHKSGNLRPATVRRIIDAAHEGKCLSHLSGWVNGRSVGPVVTDPRRVKAFCQKNPKIGKLIMALFEKNRRAVACRSQRLVAAPAVMRDNGTYTMEAIRHACANVWEPIRNDVMADMILATSEGKFHPKDANAYVAAFVKKYNRDNRHDVGSRWGNLSLDQPIGDDDTGSFYEIIRDDQRLWG